MPARPPLAKAVPDLEAAPDLRAVPYLARVLALSHRRAYAAALWSAAAAATHGFRLTPLEGVALVVGCLACALTVRMVCRQALVLWAEVRPEGVRRARRASAFAYARPPRSPYEAAVLRAFADLDEAARDGRAPESGR